MEEQNIDTQICTLSIWDLFKNKLKAQAKIQVLNFLNISSKFLFVFLIFMAPCKINSIVIITLSLSHGGRRQCDVMERQISFSLSLLSYQHSAARRRISLPHITILTPSERARVHSLGDIFVCTGVLLFSCRVLCRSARDGFLNNGGAHMHKQAEWIKSHNNDYLGGNEEECCLLLRRNTHSACFFRARERASAEKQVICECGLYFYLWNYFDHKVQ